MSRIWDGACGSCFRQLIAFVVVPNLPFLLLRLFLPANRSVVALDYLGVGIIAALLPPGSFLVSFLFIAVLVLDAVKTFAGIYYFTFTDAIRETGNLVHVSLWLTLPRIFLVLGGAYLISWAAMRISRQTQPGLKLRLLGLTFVVFVSLSLASSPLPNHTPIADSNLLLEVRASYSMLYPKPPPPVESASAALTPLIEGDSPAPKIVLIVEEAMGLSKNPAITDKVLAPILGPDVAARYEISRGAVMFHGPTLMGEGRELCHLFGNPIDLVKVSSEQLKNCLPIKLHNAGFSTTVVHGFTKTFFDRQMWYPRIGFAHLIFREELGTTAGTCGADFAGACDPQLALLIQKQLVDSPNNEKQFIYWLTLNSHEPVAKETARNSKLKCESLPNFGGQDICNMVRVQFNTNEAIERLVTAPLLPPTVFVIVGDHAPPLSSISDRDQWDQEHVPWVVLKPRIPAVVTNKQAETATKKIG